jgi:hypothetical protein
MSFLVDRNIHQFPLLVWRRGGCGQGHQGILGRQVLIVVEVESEDEKARELMKTAINKEMTCHQHQSDDNSSEQEDVIEDGSTTPRKAVSLWHFPGI